MNFVKFLGIAFRKVTISQNMKAFKLQVTSYKFRETKVCLTHIAIKIRYRKTLKISSPAYIF